MQRIANPWIQCAAAGAWLLSAACSRQPPVVDALTVSIGADNSCSMEDKPVECANVAGVIRERYPTSKPRVDICLAPGARYEAALEVTQSVTSAGFSVGSMDCKPAAG